MTSSIPLDPSAGNAGAMDLLLDIELPVLVRFGSTRMLLHELLQLKQGSVIEFNRPPEDPVEVLVNGRVVARGAAVVVEGHYGVKISEIIAGREALVPVLGSLPTTDLVEEE